MGWEERAPNEPSCDIGREPRTTPILSSSVARSRRKRWCAFGVSAKSLSRRYPVGGGIEYFIECVGRRGCEVLLLMPDGGRHSHVVELVGAGGIGMLVAWSRDEAMRILKNSR